MCISIEKLPYTGAHSLAREYSTQWVYNMLFSLPAHSGRRGEEDGNNKDRASGAERRKGKKAKTKKRNENTGRTRATIMYNDNNDEKKMCHSLNYPLERADRDSRYFGNIFFRVVDREKNMYFFLRGFFCYFLRRNKLLNRLLDFFISFFFIADTRLIHPTLRTRAIWRPLLHTICIYTHHNIEVVCRKKKQKHKFVFFSFGV